MAHSNTRFGLRILQLVSVQFPCQPYRNDALEDPFSENPAILNTFYNFTTFRNNEDGVLAEEMGWTIFDTFLVADSKRAGFEFYKTNYSKIGPMVSNALIVGQSQGNAATQPGYYNESFGIITPRNDGLNVTGV